MKKKQKAGILGAMLLLPVFLYLIVSGSNRPVTEVPNEFNVSLSHELSLDSNVHLYILSDEKVVEDLLWFEAILEKSECYTLSVVNSENSRNWEEEYDLKHVGNTNVSNSLLKGLDVYEEYYNAFLVDENGELRGVYDLRNLKEKERAKIELFILITNNQLCQKSY